MADSGVCPACLSEFQPHDQPVEHLGEPALDLAIGLYRYEGRVAQAIQRLKYERITSLADPLAKLLKSGMDELGLQHWDVVLPVPIHWRRHWWRGFNQSELLARYLKPSDRPLVRVRATRPQVRLSPEERRTNLQGAFRADGSVAGKTVLLVDDVLTSGSTARACGTALRAAGAKRIAILTLGRGNNLAQS